MWFCLWHGIQAIAKEVKKESVGESAVCEFQDDSEDIILVKK
jgi:hypothetical protein